MAREWWQSYFDAQYLREHEHLFSPTHERAHVARLIELLGLPVGSRIVDVACGQGRHARLLAGAGYEVYGLDYSARLLAEAAAGPRVPGLRFRRGDMRALPRAWSARFDAVTNLFTSFGFFRHPADDRRAAAEVARVLKPDGTFVWHGASRDGVMARFLARDWWRTTDGALIAQERSFDPVSGVLATRSAWHHRRGAGEREHRIRLYTATALAELFARVGLIVEEAYDGWRDRPLSRRSSEMLLVSRKRGG